MGLKEDVLALAEELDGVSIKDDCDACLASGTSLCRGDLECAESAHKACAKRLRDIVEHDAGEVTTMSAYDLLSEEDRKAIEWVREHGGLDTVASRIESAEIAADMLWGRGCGRFWTTDDFEEEISKRLMPEGYEWPRDETGELLRYGDRYIQDGAEHEVWHVDFDSYGDATILNADCSKCSLDKGERVKRPCKVLDADGAEIRVGDVLYRKSDGHMVEVAEVYEKTFTDADGYVRPGDGFTHRAPVIEADGKPLRVGETVWGTGREEHEYVVLGQPGLGGEAGRFKVACHDVTDDVDCDCDPDLLTHERPVLGADGVPIREGDTVYALGFGEPLTVKGFTDDGSVLMSFHDENSLGYKPSKLTHEQPDTWERLEADAEGGAKGYCSERGIAVDGGAYGQAKAVDLVRRCRALAGRSE